jgi:NADH-quinone oxidoreductase subunit L
MIRYLWLVPLLPFAGFAATGLLGRKLGRRWVASIACGAVLASFLISFGAVMGLSAAGGAERRVTQTLYTWMPIGDLHVDWSYVLDPLSAVMLLVVTGVGFLIHVYASGYMADEDDAGFARFFSYLNLFMGMMLTLVLGGTLPVIFVGWEGVGVCSYLLIGYHYDRMFDESRKMSCADAGRKAFIVNRIGDMGFMLGMLLLLGMTGTLEVQGILTSVPSLSPGVATAAALLLFFGACGKSAQIPLYVWLPDAMAGPTPVSALIHAATMVTAGVYVLCRMSPLLMASPTAMGVVATVGVLTAVFAASMGLCQRDIKKVLAYSTVSQLGYMMLAVGVGAFGAAIFHLMTHAFFKALLFLGAGSVIHALGGEQDITKMGGLRARLPKTHLTFLVGTLAIAGIPFFAGFFSKDEILWAAFERHPLLWLVGAAGAFMTAFYMTRLYLMVFGGDSRLSHEAEHHLHESPPVMTAPLQVLAVLSAIGGFVGLPAAFGLPNLLGRWLAPVFGAHEAVAGHAATASTAAAHGAGLEAALMLLSVLVACGGVALGWYLYERRPELPALMAARAGRLYDLLVNAWFVDRLYAAIILVPYDALCRAAALVDRYVVDGLVNAAGYVTLGSSYASVGFDTAVVDGLVNLTGRVVRGGSRAARSLQTGVVQSYATAMALGLFVLASAYLFLMGR